MNKHIVVDVDDILLSWHEGFFKWMSSKGWVLDESHPQDTWDMCEYFLPNEEGMIMSPTMLTMYIEEFNHYPRALKPTEGSQVYLAMLANKGYKITALTSFGGSDGSVQFRKDYLDTLYGCIDETIILPLGACKKDWLQKLNPDVFVDDNPSHAQKGIDLGIETYIIRMGYNAGVEGAKYVDNWYDIYNSLVWED